VFFEESKEEPRVEDPPSWALLSLVLDFGFPCDSEFWCDREDSCEPVYVAQRGVSEELLWEFDDPFPVLEATWVFVCS
jgi:hypothetical protein